MATELQTSQQFQERVFEKIRDSLGDLLTNEELKSILDTAMERALFAEKKRVDRWGNSDGTDPSWLQREVGNLLAPMVKEAVAAWMAEPENNDRVAKAIGGALQDGAEGILRRWFFEKLSVPMDTLRINLEQVIRKIGQ